MGRRIRTVKPEFFTNEDVQSVPADVRYTLIGLFFYADDYGRAPANLGLMRAAVFPLDEEMTSSKLESHLLELAEADLVQLYDVKGRSYVLVNEWNYWQRIDRPTESRLPGPEIEPLASPREDSHKAEMFFAGEGREARGESVSGESERRDQPRAFASEPVSPQPSPFCAKHDATNEKPCWPCKHARERSEAWQEEALAPRTVAFVQSEPEYPDPNDPEWDGE